MRTIDFISSNAIKMALVFLTGAPFAFSCSSNDQVIIPPGNQESSTGEPAPATEDLPLFSVENGDTTWSYVDEMPVYKGGDTALLHFISRNVKYPETAKQQGIQGTVIVKFRVMTDGNVDDVNVIRGASPELDAEAARVVSELSDFEKPGIKDGRAVNVWYAVPINFVLK